MSGRVRYKCKVAQMCSFDGENRLLPLLAQFAMRSTRQKQARLGVEASQKSCSQQNEPRSYPLWSQSVARDQSLSAVRIQMSRAVELHLRALPSSPLCHHGVALHGVYSHSTSLLNAELLLNMPSSSPHPPTPVGINAAVLVKEIERLLHVRLYRSAHILANFLLPAHTPFQLSLSSPVASKQLGTVSPSPALRFYLFAATLNNPQLREYRRALAYYQSALDALSAAPATSDVSATSVKVAMVDAHLAVDDSDAAIALMAQLNSAAQPSPLRVDQLSALASLYRSRNKHNEALQVYRQILHVEPHAVDALVAVMQITDADVRAVFPPAVDSLHPSVHSYLLALLSSSSADSSNVPAAVRSLSAVCSAHPLSGWLWTEKAAVQQQWCDDSISATTLEHAHSVDGRMLDGMDRMALMWLLEGGAKARHLGRLQHALLAADEKRVEGWLVAAMAATQAGSRDRCERYLDKAAHLNEQHINSHLVKAQLILHANTVLPTNPANSTPISPADSLPAFQRALNLHYTFQPAQPALHILHPMLVAHVAAGQTAKAQATAVALHQRWKANPRVLTLLALCITAAAGEGEGKARDKARKCVEKAVAIDPTHATALCAYADCLVAEGRVGDAVAVLRRSCAEAGGGEGAGGGCLWVESVVVKLADCYAMGGERGEAVRWYLQALKINKRSQAATEGLKRIEELVQ